MDDLLETFKQLSETERRQLLDYADTLLLHQKARKSEGDLAAWKERIKKVSTWTEEDILVVEENSKKLNGWKIPEW